jgi:hypothetical protein
MEVKVLFAGLLMTFGAAAVAFYVRIPPAMRNPWMNQPLVALIGNLGGFIAGIYSVYFLGSRLGWLPGIAVWVIGGFVSATVVGATMGYYPLMFILGLVAIVLGFGLSVY